MDSLRSKRFRLVSEQKKTVEGDFRFWPRNKTRTMGYWLRVHSGSRNNNNNYYYCCCCCWWWWWWYLLGLIIGFTCPPTIHFKFIIKSDKFYYKLRQLILLRSATGISKCATIITKCDRTLFARQSCHGINEQWWSHQEIPTHFLFLSVLLLFLAELNKRPARTIINSSS